jgi:hypothetical protein
MELIRTIAEEHLLWSGERIRIRARVHDGHEHEVGRERERPRRS